MFFRVPNPCFCVRCVSRQPSAGIWPVPGVDFRVAGILSWKNPSWRNRSTHDLFWKVSFVAFTNIPLGTIDTMPLQDVNFGAPMRFWPQVFGVAEKVDLMIVCISASHHFWVTQGWMDCSKTRCRQLLISAVQAEHSIDNFIALKYNEKWSSVENPFENTSLWDHFSNIFSCGMLWHFVALQLRKGFCYKAGLPNCRKSCIATLCRYI